MKSSLVPVGLLVLFPPMWAQGTKPKATPGDYPASVQLARITLAAENLGHNIPTDKGAVFTRDYISIEVAVFAPDREYLTFSAGQFDLRINGKSAMLAQSAGMVAASLKYDDWTDRPRAIGSGGIGDGGVIIGAPTPRERFPGDPTATSRIPRSPRVDTSNPNIPEEEPVAIDELVQRASLPSGENLVAPFSGLLYFPYKGKLAKIKSMELRYSGPYGEAVLRLR